MNFIAFSVDSTNICPMANSHTGGQLVTEYSLRAMQSLNTPESIEYLVGPSYAHGEHDFYVQTTAGSSSILEITAGRASVNGYFIESHTAINIDMIQLAADAIAAGQAALTGELTVGLRTMFSTEATIMGSLKVENTGTGLYEGIQVVILPKELVVLPEDSPTDQAAVNMYLKLADFTFLNGNIVNIVNNYPGKCQYIPANRIDDIDLVISETYLKKTGLNPNRLYVYSGKSNDPNVGGNTWCDATDSLMVWSSGIPAMVEDEPAVKRAMFLSDTSADTVVLELPHKQIDGAAGYFPNERLPLPKASFELGTPGVISAEYTDKMRYILNKINDIYAINTSRAFMRKFIPELHDRSELPPINQYWLPGDYIMVGNDFTVDVSNVDGSAPSTMYIVMPGVVRAIRVDTRNPHSVDNYNGVELDRLTVSDEDNPDGPMWEDEYYTEYQTAYWDISAYNGSAFQYGRVGSKDFFIYDWVRHITTTTEVGGETVEETTEEHEIYVYGVSAAGDMFYSDPMMLNGGIPLADYGTIGGFYNISTENLDKGYVYLDTDGHLRLLDYGLLRSGAAAYQLGEDFTVPSGLDLNGIQEVLDEYVNQRVAFPNETQMQTANPNLINVYIDMSSLEGEEGYINIYDIDSRFGAAVVLHLIGDAPSTVTVSITNCEKIMIDSSISGNPTINLHNSCLYYNPDVMNVMNDITDLRLWYEKYSEDDPDLVVDGLTVKQVATSGQYTVQDYASSEYWSEADPNDNHFTVCLQSLTFGADGYMSGCGVYVRNESTTNVQTGTFIISDTFKMPIGPGLMYPTSRINKQVKVTGQFISAYQQSDPIGYMVQETSFSLFTPTYYSTGAAASEGTIAFLVKSYLIQTPDSEYISVWDPGSFHYFEGVTAL